MYYDKSTFPIFFFLPNKDNFSLEKVYDFYNFLISHEDFEKQFFANILSKKKQDLFGYLITVLPILIISDFRKFTKIEFKLLSDESELLNFSEIQDLASIRIDLKLINTKLQELSKSQFIEKVNVDKIILDLILFIHKYVFIKLTKNIISTEINNKQFIFDIQKDSKKFEKYKSIKNTPSDRVVAQKIFMTNYLKSYGTENIDRINEIENELIFMSNRINQKKLLNSILEDNIVFSDKTTSRKKNDLMIFFFKNIIAKIFFQGLDENLVKDYEVKNAFNHFRKSLK
jgi:hypothetical protein